MKIKDIIDALERFAPLPLQDDFDNSGLQVGLTETEATGALLCLDVTEAVVDEAVRKGCNLIVSHHPILFFPIKSLTDTDYIGRTIMSAIKNGITLYALHTNLDNVHNGVNSRIANIIGVKNAVPILSKQDGNGSGLIGELDESITAHQLLDILKKRFDVPCIKHNGNLDRKVRRIALCGGAGSFLIPEALKQGADAFVTGEVGYHRFFGMEKRINLLEMGHFESEQFTVDLLAEIISMAFPGFPLNKTEVCTNPIDYYK